MTTINSTTATQAASTSATATSSSVADSLDINDFITLMTTQLQNQDPTNPQDATEYVSQLAQFATVSGVQSMESSISDLADSLRASQALSGSSLIGRSVLVPATSVSINSGDTVTGAVDAPSGTSAVQITVTNSAGETVRTITSSASEGLNSFTWDGLAQDGTQAAAGKYTFSAVTNADGSAEGASMLLQSTVSSVTIDSATSDLSLNTATLGSVSLSDVREIV